MYSSAIYGLHQNFINVNVMKWHSSLICQFSNSSRISYIFFIYFSSKITSLIFCTLPEYSSRQLHFIVINSLLFQGISSSEGSCKCKHVQVKKLQAFEGFGTFISSSAALIYEVSVPNSLKRGFTIVVFVLRFCNIMINSFKKIKIKIIQSLHVEI